MAVDARFRREWRKKNPILDMNVIGIDLNDNSTKLGDGKTRWNDLEYRPVGGGTTQVVQSGGGTSGGVGSAELATAVAELNASIATRQASATAATDPELDAAVASLNALIAPKQDAATAATDSELANAIAGLNATIAAKQDSATAATDAELAAQLATLTAAISAKQDASLAATDAEVAAAIAAQLAKLIQVVRYGVDVNTPRPVDANIVYWVGTGTPVNSIDADIIYDSAA